MECPLGHFRPPLPPCLGKNWMDQVDAGPVLSLFRCELLVGLIREAYWRRCHLKGTSKEFQQQQMRNGRRKQTVMAGFRHPRKVSIPVWLDEGRGKTHPGM